MPLTQNATPHIEFCIAIPYVKTLSGGRTRYLRILRERKEKEKENFTPSYESTALSNLLSNATFTDTFTFS